jgi:hypothetical protein
LVDVKVSVTVPADISPALGMYEPFKVLDEGLKLPLPEVVQLPVVDPPITVPFKASVEVLQMVWPVPAFTVGEGVMWMTRVLVAGGQEPLLVDVSVIVTEPADISPPLGT